MQRMRIPPAMAKALRTMYGSQLCSDKYTECLYRRGRRAIPTNHPMLAPLKNKTHAYLAQLL